MLLNVADVADDVAGVAAVDETEEDRRDEEELFLGNFKVAFLLMLDNGLKIESTYKGKRDVHNSSSLALS